MFSKLGRMCFFFCCCRGVGPAMGGVLWAFSLGLLSSGQQYLSFGIVAITSLSAVALYRHVNIAKLR